MPSYIVKIAPERDEYVYWSSIVEAPLFHGDRAELTDYLLHHAHRGGEEAAAPARFDRADKTGTSSMDGFYGWDEEEFITEQRGLVKRLDLPELARCLANREPYPHILHPFEDGHIKGWN